MERTRIELVGANWEGSHRRTWAPHFLFILRIYYTFQPFLAYL